MNIVHYCDPGHGWMKVSKALLVKLGIAHMISSFSYERNDMAYLEEDCDAGLLLRKLEMRDIKFVIKSMHTNKTSKIRNYKRFNFKG